jgi:Ca2+-binding EF-hand superfamily protein
MTMTVRLTSTLALAALLGATLSGSVALAETGPGGDRGAMFLEMFDEIDTNGDGQLSQEELEAHRLARFTAADTNKDGKLDAAEVAAAELARFTAEQEKRTARIIENRDADGDGTISAEEMGEGPMERHFARIDADNDGSISKAEAEEAAEHMHKRGKHRRAMMGGDN